MRPLETPLLSRSLFWICSALLHAALYVAVRGAVLGSASELTLPSGSAGGSDHASVSADCDEAPLTLVPVPANPERVIPDSSSPPFVAELMDTPLPPAPSFDPAPDPPPDAPTLEPDPTMLELPETFVPADLIADAAFDRRAPSDSFGGTPATQRSVGPRVARRSKRTSGSVPAETDTRGAIGVGVGVGTPAGSPATATGAPGPNGNDSAVAIQSSDILSAPKTTYPRRAVTLGLEGEVILLAIVDQEGAVTECILEKSSGHDLLDEAARKALLRWRFHPKLVDGVPRGFIARVPFHFFIPKS